ncbi:response regulator [Marinobacter adhaerens]|jgi:two-component system, OmpR family, response regulator|uniref:response regulator n=1 Tax=Marinobacter adhaerens TaxID=1033846 RepID=UPI001E51ABD8|nr:response regulator [Marinobacter adhaerens]MCD1646106.1 response regulator [Marinobacter adhaerens]
MTSGNSTSISRVLYVEDDPDIRAIAEIALQEVGGLEAALCESGAVAVETAPGFDPELFLLDVMMPGMDGPTTLKALRELDGMAEVPVIFMTARLQSSEIREYRELGALGVIPKPFDPMTLSDQIAEMLRDARSY